MSKYVSTMHSFKAEEIFTLCSFVFPKKNLGNFTKYIFDNVLILLNSFPPLITTMIGWI